MAKKPTTRPESAILEHDPNKIDARPTKELFINMLILDLRLRDAIGDLVDNSVDAARTIIGQAQQMDQSPDVLLESLRYDELAIKMTLSPTQFIIEDNCGGMEASVARDFAFRFGRDAGAPPTPGSVGRFGIGMKRALFKLGKKFQIKSVAKNSSFTIKVDVEDWSSKSAWDFDFSQLRENLPDANPRDRGLRIEVTDLNPDVANLLGTTAFESDLGDELSSENQFNINRGLTISVNSKDLPAKALVMLSSPDFKAGRFKETYLVRDESGEDVDVNVHIIAGIGEAELADGGWYIFCNDRLVAGAEQTGVSGWTGQYSDGVAKYHDQFERFRGYVFFSSVNAEVLPWNTTKTSMNMDSRLYREVRAKMIEMMRPVITFLNLLKKEKEGGNPAENQPLNLKVSQTSAVSVLEIPEDQQDTKFVPPTAPPPVRAESNEQKIGYAAPKVKIDKVKKSLKVTTLKEVGELTFEYYYQNEVG